MAAKKEKTVLDSLRIAIKEDKKLYQTMKTEIARATYEVLYESDLVTPPGKLQYLSQQAAKKYLDMLIA